MQSLTLKRRDLYLKKMIAFQDTEMIKIITGIRRCGKSSLMKLMAQHLRGKGVAEDQILEMNFESMRFPEMDARTFYDYIKARLAKGRRTYLFFDEIQRLEGWENAVNAFRVDFDCDIYLTGSNAYLLSSELTTYLSGRYVEIKVLPLSFKEFLDFHAYTVSERPSPSGGTRRRIVDAAGESFEARELYAAYVRFGGMPMLADVGLEIDRVTAALDGVYSAAVVNDILERERRKGRKMITDPALLRKIIMSLADNIGSNTSATSIAKTLMHEGLLSEGGRRRKPATQTVLSYIDALRDAYVFYEVRRFDVKGKAYLRTLAKYYIVDIGLRQYLLGYRGGDSGHVLENIVYFELLRRGYDVAVGKIGDQEIDFVATKADRKKYIQVTESLYSPETKAREFDPLRRIRDNHEKLLIVLDGDSARTEDGIRVVGALEYLLEDEA